MASKVVEETAKFKGLTRKKLKRINGNMGSNSTPGRSKGENCQATGLDKAMAKYPRAYRTMPEAYQNWCIKKDKAAGRISKKR